MPAGTAVVYISPWCPHCKDTFAELREDGIPFVTRDIFDPKYRDTYVKKMESIGRRPPAVPLVDYHGQLLIGLDCCDASMVKSDIEHGRTPDPQERPGVATPKVPLKPWYTPGTRWHEPPAEPAVIYGGKWCVHCPAVRKFLRARKIPFVTKDQNKAAVAAELEKHLNTLGRSGPTAPVIKLHGRILVGFDKDAIESIRTWRNTTR